MRKKWDKWNVCLEVLWMSGKEAFEWEINIKLNRISRFLEDQKLEAVAFSTQSNFAWATVGGDSHVSVASDIGSATVVFTRSGRRFAICDAIEAPRIMEEELEGKGFELISFPWDRPILVEKILEVAGERCGSDIGIGGMQNIDTAFGPCRYSLTPQEIERYEHVGKWASESVNETCREIKPGMSELEIAALVDQKLICRGLIPNVTLIAVDERIEKFRHAIPTEKRLERLAMVVVAARKWGLIVSLTRLVHFGKIPDELRRKHKAVTTVDAVFIANTVPGQNISELFDKGLKAYADAGFADEWTKHHQGGPTGYRGREYRAHSKIDGKVCEDQAWAWNPSITGTKSEDTIIASSDGQKIISEIPGWPRIEFFVNGRVVSRPDILEIR